MSTDSTPGHTVTPEQSRLVDYLQQALQDDIEWVALVDICDDLDLDESEVEEMMGQLEQHPGIDVTRDFATPVVGWEIDTPA